MIQPKRQQLWNVIRLILTVSSASGIVLLIGKLVYGLWSAYNRRAVEQDAESEEEKEWIIYIPIPWISKPIQVHDHDNMTQYLNHISQSFDFLYKNYVNYRQKMYQVPSYVLEKRLKPIVIEQKFLLAKQLLTQDLQDLIEKCTLQIIVYKQQIRELRKRLPPQMPFLVKKKYSPYYWILTDVDYTQMNPVLRNALLHNNSYRQYSSYSSYGTTARSGLNKSQMTAEDERELDQFLLYNPYSTIRQRYLKLRSTWAEQNDMNHIVEREQDNLFADYCYKLLRRRKRIITRKLRQIRRFNIRNTIRERSRRASELSLCNRLKLNKLTVPVRTS